MNGESKVKETFFTTYENVQIDTDINVASQHSLQSQVDKWDFDLFKEFCSIRVKGRLNITYEPHAEAWLKAIPNPNLGLAMSCHEFTIAVHLWLDLPLFSSFPNAVRCICCQVLDKFGDHLLGCRKISLRSRRHDALKDVIFQALLVHDKETRRDQSSSSVNYSRPGDVYHPNFLFGRPAYFDVNVCNSFQQRFVSHSASNACFAALEREISKCMKYDTQVFSSGALFIPLAVESFGTWSDVSLNTLKTIASKTVSVNSIPFSQSLNNLLQQLSVKSWSYNASMILSRLLLDINDSNFSLRDLPVS